MNPFTAKILTWIVTRFSRLPLSFLLKIHQKLSVSINIKLVQYAWPDLPLSNVDTPFEPLSTDKQVRWMFEVESREPDDPVIVFLHGGGYCFGLFPPFLSMLLVLYEKLGREQSRLSVLVLDYTLGTQFPTQLNQFIDLYQSLQMTSKNITLLGDSAGGHLALSLVRHSQRPMATVPPIELGEELQNLILLSPWVNLWPEETPGSSYELFGSTDMLPVSLLKSMGLNFYNDTDRDMVDPMTWEDIQLPRAFICCGAKECMRDDILKFAHKHQIQLFVDVDHGLHDSAPFWPNEIMQAVADFLQHSPN